MAIIAQPHPPPRGGALQGGEVHRHRAAYSSLGVPPRAGSTQNRSKMKWALV